MLETVRVFDTWTYYAQVSLTSRPSVRWSQEIVALDFKTIYVLDSELSPKEIRPKLLAYTSLSKIDLRHNWPNKSNWPM